MIQCFPKPYNSSIRNAKVELELSNDATKADLKAGTDVGIPNLAAVSDLASLKSEVDKKDTDILKNVAIDLSMLSNVVDNDVAKKIVFNELVTKFNAIKIRSTSGLISKIPHKYGKQKLEKKI